MDAHTNNNINELKIWRIGIFGTFDVQNYGDLLFPIIARLELSHRLNAVEIIPFSYHAKSFPDWPYEVISLTELPKKAHELDAILIGGGFIIRFDKFIAPEYEPPEEWIHHPTGYWLTPALLGAQHGIPVIWNAPGMHCNDIPIWSHALLSLALEYSAHIAVRDEPSRDSLTKFVNSPERVKLIPDTAFNLGRHMHSRVAAEEAHAILEGLGLKQPYIVIQATQNLEKLTDHIKRFQGELPQLSFLLLRLGPVLCDHESFIDNTLPHTYSLTEWPSPMVLAELIGGAEAAFGHSYHLAITALCSGVPVFTSSDLSVGKFTALSPFETVHSLESMNCDDPRWLADRIGRKNPSPLVEDAARELDEHWNQVVHAIKDCRHDSRSQINKFWMSLPTLLENNVALLPNNAT